MLRGYSLYSVDSLVQSIGKTSPKMKIPQLLEASTGTSAVDTFQINVLYLLAIAEIIYCIAHLWAS